MPMMVMAQMSQVAQTNVGVAMNKWYTKQQRKAETWSTLTMTQQN